MNKKRILETLEKLQYECNSYEEITSLQIAKKSIQTETFFKLLMTLILMITTVVVFGSLVLIAYFMYCR